MQCTNPGNYRKDGSYNYHVPPCGNCLSCSLNSRHIWAARLVLERKCYPDAQFITLTYDNDHLPQSSEQLKPDFQKFIKLFRYHTGQQPRYFACMEYGSRYGRPHFHAIFFGRETQLAARIAKRSQNTSVIKVDPVIEDTWGKGSTYVKACNTGTQASNITQYVAGYVLKNRWNPDAGSSKTEWALQSRKPYIGQPAMKMMLDALTTYSGARHCGILGTVPDTFKMAGRHYRLPPRIRKELCEELGYPYLQLPYTDGTIINIDGMEVRNELPRKALTQKEAILKERTIQRKIYRNRLRNPTTATG